MFIFGLDYRYRKDEIFRRIKATTFVQLVLQVYGIPEDEDLSIDQGQYDDENGSAHQQPGPDYQHDIPPLDLSKVSSQKEDTDEVLTARSSLSDFVRGSGEIKVQEDKEPSVSSKCPYLLLDVREKDDYDQCRLIGAVSYPAAMLSRSFNYFTKEILTYKNKPGHIIILYDENERIAPNAATTFVQREVDNVFMLSGGLNVLSQKFPAGIISGTLPESCKPLSRGQSSARQARCQTCSQITTQTPVMHKNTFTPDDLDKLQNKLDDILLTESESASRLSSSASRVASSRSTVRTGAGSIMPSSARSTSSQPPWK